MKLSVDPHKAYRGRVAALFSRLDRLVPDYGLERSDAEARRPRKRCRFTILRHAIKLFNLIKLDAQVQSLVKISEERANCQNLQHSSEEASCAVVATAPSAQRSFSYTILPGNLGSPTKLQRNPTAQALPVSRDHVGQLQRKSGLIEEAEVTDAAFSQISFKVEGAETSPPIAEALNEAAGSSSQGPYLASEVLAALGGECASKHRPEYEGEFLAEQEDTSANLPTASHAGWEIDSFLHALHGSSGAQNDCSQHPASSVLEWTQTSRENH
mmetsp:Transcript_39227/g.79163  ORF Transcript_39227/g.79163 Transcript_39227/m.79163 type:complete len:270 (+) Transcript_39227:71-880(+)